MSNPRPRAVKNRVRARALPKALTLSLVFHLLLFVTVDALTGLQLIFRSVPSSMEQLRAEAKANAERRDEANREEPPLVFVHVDPEQAAPEPPPETKFYSSANVQAANPEPSRNLPTPQIDGPQEEVPNTLESPKTPPVEAVAPVEPTEIVTAPEPVRTEPTLAPEPIIPPVDPKPEEVARVEPKPEPKADVKPEEPLPTLPDPEALAIAPPPEAAIPQREPPVAEQPKPRQRPRTLAQARQQRGIVTEERMKSDGGVQRFALEATLDVKGTPFGSYDAEFIAAVRNRWFQLLEQKKSIGGFRGKVVVEFRMMPNGLIENLTVAENEVDGTLGYICAQAVQDPAPYKPFPSDLRRLLKNKHRDVRFTFHYR